MLIVQVLLFSISLGVAFGDLFNLILEKESSCLDELSFFFVKWLLEFHSLELDFLCFT